MKLSVPVFKGEAPRISPRVLPDEMSQEAINCRVLTGDLQGWRNFRTEQALCKGDDVNTVYLLEGEHWLHWTDAELAADAVEVDVAKSTIAGDDTGRVYLTGLIAGPRWTDVDLATTGSGCYPITTRPLGVPAPEIAPITSAEVSEDPGVDIDDAGDSLASQWTTSPDINVNGVVSLVSQDAAVGNPLPSYKITYNNNVNATAYAYRDFGIGNSATASFEAQFMLDRTENADLVYEASFRAFCSAGGTGPVVKVSTLPIPGEAAAERLYIGTRNGWSPSAWSPQLINVMPMSLSDGVWYTMRISQSRATLTGNAQLTVQIIDVDGTTVLMERTVTTAISGGFCGIEGSTSYGATPPDGNIETNYDNFNTAGSAPFQGADDSLATSYVYTFVNDQGEESAPSPASDTIIRDDGTAVTIITPATVPTGYEDYNVVYKRIYRAVSGAAGTAFQFVAEIYLLTVSYVDTLTDAQLGEELESSNWDLPPSNLRGILALPNDIYVGFFGNTLCFSVQGRAHAWPVEWRLATDHAIVGIGNIDTTVVAFTTAFPYLAAGNAPDAYSMSKLEVPQGCVSKRSIAYLKGLGVVGATEDGLMAIAGTGAVGLVTEPLFTREDWQAIEPASLIASAHDDRYIGFYDTGAARRGLILDLKPGGFGKVTLAAYARAVFTDAERDDLYLVLEDNDPPSASGSPGQVVPDGATIYQFDAEEPDGDLTPYLPFSWRSKLWQLPQPDYPQFGMVRALNYGTTIIAFLADGASYYSRVVTSPAAFRLPRLGQPANSFEIVLTSAGQGDRISGVQCADEVMDFDL